MAIVKHGDNMPVLSYYDVDGEEKTCPKCGHKLVVVAVEGQNNKLVCESCDEEDE